MIIFLDLDGVVYDNKIPLHRYNEPDIFKNVGLLDGAKEFVKELKSIAPVIVISKTFTEELHHIHEKDKLTRIRHDFHIHYTNAIILPPRINKNIFSAHSHILIDDYGKNCIDWQKAGGISIQFAEEKKKDHLTAFSYDDVIRKCRLIKASLCMQ